MLRMWQSSHLFISSKHSFYYFSLSSISSFLPPIQTSLFISFYSVYVQNIHTHVSGMCTHPCKQNVCTPMWRPEVDIQCLSQLLLHSLFFEIGYLTEHNWTGQQVPDICLSLSQMLGSQTHSCFMRMLRIWTWVLL